MINFQFSLAEHIVVLIRKILLIQILIFCQLHAYSANYFVTNGNDSGVGSLRQAIDDAIANPGHDDITVQPSVFVINLSTNTVIPPGFIDNNMPNLSDVTINGNDVVINSSIDSRFALLGNNVILNDLKFSGFTNGCLHVNPSNGFVVAINNCDFSNNSSAGIFPFGGSIWHIDGHLKLTSCTFTNCSANIAGAIFCHATSDKLSVDNCSFAGNISTNNGGNANAIYLEGAAVLELSGATSFGASPVQDINKSGGDAPFTGSIILLPSFSTTPGSQLDITS